MDGIPRDVYTANIEPFLGLEVIIRLSAVCRYFRGIYSRAFIMKFADAQAQAFYDRCRATNFAEEARHADKALLHYIARYKHKNIVSTNDVGTMIDVLLNRLSTQKCFEYLQGCVATMDKYQRDCGPFNMFRQTVLKICHEMFKRSLLLEWMGSVSLHFGKYPSNFYENLISCWWNVRRDNLPHSSALCAYTYYWIKKHNIPYVHDVLLYLRDEIETSHKPPFEIARMAIQIHERLNDCLPITKYFSIWYIIIYNHFNVFLDNQMSLKTLTHLKNHIVARYNTCKNNIDSRDAELMEKILVMYNI